MLLTHIAQCVIIIFEVILMAQSKAHSIASNKYNAKAYDRLAIQVYKGQRELIKTHAEANGESLNGYINRLIAEDMGEALTRPQEQDD